MGQPQVVGSDPDDILAQRKDVVREFYRIKNERDYGALKDVFVPGFTGEFVRHFGDAEPFDIDRLAKKYSEYVQCFPDLHYDVTNLVAEGDWVVARLHYRGTHLGPLANGKVPPTGRQIEVHQHLSFRFDGTRIVQMHSTADFLGGMWTRIGVQPPDVAAVAPLTPSPVDRAGGDGPFTPDSEDPSLVRNKAAVIEYHRLKNERDWDALDAVMAEDFHTTFVRFHGGKEEFDVPWLKEKFAEYLTVFPDLHHELYEIIAEGRWVVARLHYTGTHLGEIMGIAPTGRSIDVHQHLSFEFNEEGRIVDIFSSADLLGGIWGRIGVTPPIAPLD